MSSNYTFIKLYDPIEEVDVFIRSDYIFKIYINYRMEKYRIAVKTIDRYEYYLTDRVEKYDKKEDALINMIIFLEKNKLNFYT